MSNPNRKTHVQRFRSLLTQNALKRWLHYTWLGGGWLWGLASVVVTATSNHGWSLQARAVDLLVTGALSLSIAAIGSLPILVHEEIDEIPGNIGSGFVLGMLATVALIALGFMALAGLGDLMTGISVETNRIVPGLR
jgi:hypothetical protein